MHLRRAEGAGLLGRRGLRAEGRSFREKFNLYTISHECPFLLPWGVSPGPEAPVSGSRELYIGGTCPSVLLPQCSLLVQPSISGYRKRCRLIGSVQQGRWSRDTKALLSLQQIGRVAGRGKSRVRCTLPISPSYSPWGLWVPPHGISPKVSWCVWLVGNPVCEPCTSGLHSRAPKRPGGPQARDAGKWPSSHCLLPSPCAIRALLRVPCLARATSPWPMRSLRGW